MSFVFHTILPLRVLALLCNEGRCWSIQAATLLLHTRGGSFQKVWGRAHISNFLPCSFLFYPELPGRTILVAREAWALAENTYVRESTGAHWSSASHEQPPETVIAIASTKTSSPFGPKAIEPSQLDRLSDLHLACISSGVRILVLVQRLLSRLACKVVTRPNRRSSWNLCPSQHTLQPILSRGAERRLCATHLRRYPRLCP